MSEEAIYQRSPIWLQTLLLNAHAWRIQRERYGPAFRALQMQWDRLECEQAELRRNWQDERLVELVRLAYERVPFYRRRYRDHGVSPADVQGMDDLYKLPIVTKEDVRSATAAMCVDGAHDTLVHGHTSGTTGSPLGVWYDRGMSVANAVADWRQKRWGGMDRGDWCGMFLGRVVVPLDQERPPFWRVNLVHHQVWYSAFHMQPAHLDAYTRDIRCRRLRFLEGYPSTIHILAQHLLERGEQLRLQAVFTSSETLHDVQREAIQSAFKCPIFDFYGLAERVIFAAECDAHDGKHVFEEYGIAEIVADDGQVVEGTKPGWLVGTSLWNRGMPLIRYRTSDLSSWVPGVCACGRTLRRIASVTTKAEDVVITPDGRFISPSVLTHPFKPFDTLVKSQLVQDAEDHLLVKLVPSSAFTASEQEALLSGLRARLGEAMRIDVVIVDDIPPEKSGKYRWVISKVPHACRVAWGA